MRGSDCSLEPVDLIIVALAATRLTSLIVEDRITAPFREWVLDHSAVFIVELISCFYCTAVWASLVCVLMWFVPLVGYYVLVVLAVAQVAEMVYRYARGI